MIYTILNYSILLILVISLTLYLIVTKDKFKDSENEILNRELKNFTQKNENKNENEKEIEKIEETKEIKQIKEAKEIQKKLKEETPSVVDVIKSANLPVYYNLNSIPITNCGSNINRLNCSTAPKWWYPNNEYDPDKFKEKVSLEYYNPIYNVLGNAQETYWDFKKVLN